MSAPRCCDPQLRRALLRCRKCLIEIGDDIVDMFDPDAKPDHLRLHAGAAELFRCELPVGCGSRMASERFGVANVHKPLEELQFVIKPFAFFETTFHAEGEKRAALAF